MLSKSRPADRPWNCANLACRQPEPHPHPPPRPRKKASHENYADRWVGNRSPTRKVMSISSSTSCQPYAASLHEIWGDSDRALSIKITDRIHLSRVKTMRTAKSRFRPRYDALRRNAWSDAPRPLAMQRIATRSVPPQRTQSVRCGAFPRGASERGSICGSGAAGRLPPLSVEDGIGQVAATCVFASRMRPAQLGRMQAGRGFRVPAPR
jgi:hypothetical protein